MPPKIDYMGCQLDPEQKKVWASLAKRKLVVTKFFAPGALDELGLTEIIETLLGRVGLRNMTRLHAHTYARFTLEFLSTLQFHHGKPFYITFRLNNMDRRMSSDDLWAAFGWDRVRSVKYESLDAHGVAAFWETITRTPLPRRGAKANDIPHPSLRLIQRVLAMTVFCHAEPSDATHQEINALWTMTPQGKGRPNWARIFVDGCLRVIDSKKAAKMSMGGMITIIARHLGIAEPPASERAAGDTLLTLAILQRLDLLEIVKMGRYFWYCGTKHHRYLRLPRPDNDPFTYGDTAEDFFVPPDADFVMAFRARAESEPPVADNAEFDDGEGGSGGAEAMEEDAPRPTSGHPPQDNDYWSWRASVDDKLENLEDIGMKTLELLRSMSRMCSIRYPESYQEPSMEFYDRLAARRLARADREVARNRFGGRIGAGPSMS